MTKQEAELIQKVIDTLSQRIGDVAPGKHTNFYADYNEASTILRKYQEGEKG